MMMSPDWLHYLQLANVVMNVFLPLNVILNVILALRRASIPSRDRTSQFFLPRPDSNLTDTMQALHVTSQCYNLSDFLVTTSSACSPSIRTELLPIYTGQKGCSAHFEVPGLSSTAPLAQELKACRVGLRSHRAVKQLHLRPLDLTGAGVPHWHCKPSYPQVCKLQSFQSHSSDFSFKQRHF